MLSFITFFFLRIRRNYKESVVSSDCQPIAGGADAGTASQGQSGGTSRHRSADSSRLTLQSGKLTLHFLINSDLSRKNNVMNDRLPV